MGIKDFILVFWILLTISWFVFAWREPTFSPPGGSGALQVSDTGDVIVTNSLTVNNQLNVSGNVNFQANALVNGNLTVGNSANPKGITLYATNTGNPYCLRIYVSGTPMLDISAGACP